MLVENILNGVMDPSKILFKLWKKGQWGSFQSRLKYDILERPHYAYCMTKAAILAKNLGLKKISALEFGVAGGNGVKAIESLSHEIKRIYDVEFEIYGFDSGEGLPKPQGYRDMPYIWKEGFFEMDKDKLQAKLKKTKLVFGNVENTVSSFFENYTPAPVGAVFHDLDYYSSTKEALKLFEKSSEYMLPRVFCYFDDIMSSEQGFMCEFVGQLLAIEEFNKNYQNFKLGKINGLSYTRKVKSIWNDQIYILHRFDHPKYNEYVHSESDRQLELR